MLRRWPSFGGFSLYMAACRPFAPAVLRSVLQPTFSAAECQATPAWLIRVVNDGSPGSWWDSWLAAAMARLCRRALLGNAVLAPRAGRWLVARSALSIRSTLVAAAVSAVVAADAGTGWASRTAAEARAAAKATTARASCRRRDGRARATTCEQDIGSPPLHS